VTPAEARTAAPFPSVIESVDELRALVPPPIEMVCRKVIDRLDAHCRALIAHAPFLALATSSRAGDCDVSPRGDAPGFVLVLDERRLVIPDRPGNRRLDNMQNVLENPHVGLLFIIPGLEETLRVNGQAWITRDEGILARMSVGEKRPLLGIGVEVEQCYIHCAKAFKRSGLWEPSRWPDRSDLPSIAQVLVDHLHTPGLTADAIDKGLQESYKNALY
jgi:PPOX class probable FMN-dependent enzyme